MTTFEITLLFVSVVALGAIAFQTEEERDASTRNLIRNARFIPDFPPLALFGIPVPTGPLAVSTGLFTTLAVISEQEQRPPYVVSSVDSIRLVDDEERRGLFARELNSTVFEILTDFDVCRHCTGSPLSRTFLPLVNVKVNEFIESTMKVYSENNSTPDKYFVNLKELSRRIAQYMVGECGVSDSKEC